MRKKTNNFAEVLRRMIRALVWFASLITLHVVSLSSQGISKPDDVCALPRRGRRHSSSAALVRPPLAIQLSQSPVPCYGVYNCTLLCTMPVFRSHLKTHFLLLKNRQRASCQRRPLTRQEERLRNKKRTSLQWLHVVKLKNYINLRCAQQKI